MQNLSVLAIECIVDANVSLVVCLLHVIAILSSVDVSIALETSLIDPPSRDSQH